MELPFLHVFPYSERPGTPAARMPKVPIAVRRERATCLREIGRRNAQRFLAAQIGRTVKVLTENSDSGHSEHFAPVRLATPVAPARLLTAHVVGATDAHLLAEAA
jgi:threonylcarbamoyladenosine tRNA methylthiotransferase MtaB